MLSFFFSVTDKLGPLPLIFFLIFYCFFFISILCFFWFDSSKVSFSFNVFIIFQVYNSFFSSSSMLSSTIAWIPQSYLSIKCVVCTRLVELSSLVRFYLVSFFLTYLSLIPGEKKWSSIDFMMTYCIESTTYSEEMLICICEKIEDWKSGQFSLFGPLMVVNMRVNDKPSGEIRRVKIGWKRERGGEGIDVNPTILLYIRVNTINFLRINTSFQFMEKSLSFELIMRKAI